MDKPAQCYLRYLKGDDSAFNEIMEELFFKLVFFTDGYVHDIHTAEDIALDVFSDLAAYRHRYNFKVSLKTYVFMLGKSRALDCLKRKKIISFSSLEERENTKTDLKAIEDAVLENERKRQLHKAVMSLPEDMRTAVYLVYFEDMTYREAAKVMKKNRKQIDNLLYRAKKELRNILEKDGDFSDENH